MFSGFSAGGGHNIPEQVIRRRYVAGIKNLFALYIKQVDYWDIYDNSGHPRKHIACGGKSAKTIIFDESTFANIKSYVR